MSILLPALSDAREKTISAVCLSNIRQSLVHVSIYQDDHRGMHTMYESNNGWSGWTGSLYALNYFQAKDNSIFCPKSDLGQSNGSATEWGIKQNAYAGNTRGYWNNLGWNDRTWMSYDSTGEHLNTFKIPKASEFIFLADSISQYYKNNGLIRNHSTYTTGAWSQIWTTHNPQKRANAGFLDGHAKSISISDWRSKMVSGLVFD